ncbi:hypothetical protein DAI22_02g270350 [Oryza sativa Japonica Group]|nr:hypothetical protein DAI22_02g270350 [Oryza sativa Japonica Group]
MQSDPPALSHSDPAKIPSHDTNVATEQPARRNRARSRKSTRTIGRKEARDHRPYYSGFMPDRRGPNQRSPAQIRLPSPRKPRQPTITVKAARDQQSPYEGRKEGRSEALLLGIHAGRRRGGVTAGRSPWIARRFFEPTRIWTEGGREGDASARRRRGRERKTWGKVGVRPRFCRGRDDKIPWPRKRGEAAARARVGVVEWRCGAKSQGRGSRTGRVLGVVRFDAGESLTGRGGREGPLVYTRITPAYLVM